MTNSSSNLTVEPVDFTDTTLETGLNLQDLAEGAGATSSFAVAAGTTTLDLTGLQASSNLSDMATWANGDIVSISDGTTTQTFTVGASITTVQDYVNAINDLGGMKASFDEGTDQISVISGLGTGVTLSISKDNTGGGSATDGGLTATAAPTTLTTSAMSSTATLVSSGSFEAGDILYIADGNGFESASLEIDANTTVDDLMDLINTVKGLDGSFSSGSISLIGDVSFTPSRARIRTSI